MRSSSAPPAGTWSAITGSALRSWSRRSAAIPRGRSAYSYGRLPFDFGMSVYRTLTPNRYDNTQPLFIQQNVGVAAGINYALVNDFQANSFALSYAITRFDGSLTPKRNPLAPNRS